LRLWAALGLAALAGCVRPHSAAQPHADSFVKRGFGFIGPRELSVVGSAEDVEGYGVELRLLGFTVHHAAAVDQAKTRYVAEVGGRCSEIVPAPGGGFVERRPDADVALHVAITKTSTSEKVFSALLADNDDCPAAFYRDAASAVARNWPVPAQ